MSWENKLLSEIGDIKTGGTPKTSIKKYYGDDYLFVTPSDLDFNHYYIYETERRISKFGKENYASKFIPPFSIIYTCIGNTTGKIALNKSDCMTNQQINSVVPHKDYDFRFIYYYLIDITPYIRKIGGGAATPIVNKTTFGNIEISIPPLQTQKRIADILSAYDDLIENNLKRIKLLEQATQNIYKEWFVNMRFLGHENTPINEETGLPNEWEYGMISDFGKVVTGKTPPTKRKDFYGIEVPFIKTPDMHRNVYMESVEQYISNKGADSQKNKYLPKNTVIVACIGARAGVVALTSKMSQTNQQINALIPNDRNAHFWFYFFFKGFKDELRALGSSGATMTNVSKGKFEGIKLIYPSPSSHKEFNEIASNCFDSVLNLQKQNQKLKAARDILLPRLMNRTIEV